MEAPPELTYFTCTLGEASEWNAAHPHSPHTLGDLLRAQASRHPDSPAVGFARPEGGGPRQGSLPDLYTFSSLRRHSLAAAARFHKTLAGSAQKDTQYLPRTVALLSASTPSLLITWLGLVSLGHPVLLLAPQLQTSAIAHLCTTRNVKHLFVDDGNIGKVENLQETVRSHRISELLYDLCLADPVCDALEAKVSPSDVAYLHHTSGTSSGLPKPIYQSHHGAVEVLPCLPGAQGYPSFSTTPLYHGGIADSLRAWTSEAMIWLFPDGQLPETAATVLKCIDVPEAMGMSAVRYFSCVPYILQSLAGDDDGLKMLQSMDLVGVGGAALPISVGNDLVRNGIKLVSRYGTAECGFVMSSHRDYENDKEWQFLRQRIPSSSTSFPSEGPFRFAPHGTANDDLFELIVSDRWPHLAKKNGADGSYATADLFRPHPILSNAWQYHSRADAQIVLATGKKFDPAPIESDILASSSLLRDVLVFGGGRDYPGALLFPDLIRTVTPPEDIIDSIWPALDKMNSDSQNHSRIPRSMLVVVRNDSADQTPLLKSSKGTVLRRQAEERYSQEIYAAYEVGVIGVAEWHMESDDSIFDKISDIFLRLLGHRVDGDQDLYQQGVDSISCIRIQKFIETTLLRGHRLPQNIVYDQGTLRMLADYVVQCRRGMPGQVNVEQENELDEMRRLSREYSRNFSLKSDAETVPPRQTNGQVIVLTGATGTLGAHLLQLLRDDSQVSRIICLVRAETAFAAYKRVTKSLVYRCIPGLPPFNPDTWRSSEKIVCLPCRLAEPKLGLSDTDWSSLTTKATLVIHAAWAVNFALRLRSFEDHVAATRNLLDLTMRGRSQPARFYFISSTAAVSASHQVGQPILEKVSEDPSHASPLGYSRSKWVAEEICAAAHEYLSSGIPSTPPHGQRPSVSIIRVGQLCGNSAGVWNASEAFPLMLSTAAITGCLPDLPGEVLNWLPADQAAKAIMEIVWASDYEGELLHEVPLYHVLNNHIGPTWGEMVRWIQTYYRQENLGGNAHARSRLANLSITIPSEWLAKLESVMTDEDGQADSSASHHPCRPLIPLWRLTYVEASQAPCPSRGKDKCHGDSPPACDNIPIFSTARADSISTVMRALKPLSKEQALKMFEWIRENVR